MASIYLHIPFCKQACYYCDFHFSTSLANKDLVQYAIKKELEIQSNFFDLQKEKDKIINSIYFGGGTPSLALSGNDIKEVIKLIRNNYSVCEQPEITLEANPDDLSKRLLNDLLESGVNRLSIGVQSFNQNDLTFLNRSHNSKQALNCINDAYSAGFRNISVDLIYGIQSSTQKIWQQNLNIVAGLPIEHLSCYSLTIEPRTVFSKWTKEKKIPAINDNDVIAEFDYLRKWGSENNFEHYEISNFCKNKKYSEHNTAYWKNEAYLGIGPSAHSYNLQQRFWNINNNTKYIQSLENGVLAQESETLNEKNQYNEYIMTGLRTIWGVNKTVITERFGSSIINHFNKSIDAGLKNDFLTLTDSSYVIANDKRLISDKIITSLIID